MTLTQVQAAQRRLRAASEDREAASAALRDAISEARETHSVQEIADALGVHRQRVYQILNGR